MHRRKSDLDHNRRVVLIVAGSLAVIIAVCLTIIFTADGSNGNASFQTVTQPASAKAFADQLGCSKFKQYGGGMLSGLGIRISAVDSGTCYVDGKEYTIYTFSTQDIRDEWVQAANQIRISPRWETDTSVAYLSRSNGV